MNTGRRVGCLSCLLTYSADSTGDSDGAISTRVRLLQIYAILMTMAFTVLVLRGLTEPNWLCAIGGRGSVRITPAVHHRFAIGPGSKSLPPDSSEPMRLLIMLLQGRISSDLSRPRIAAAVETCRVGYHCAVYIKYYEHMLDKRLVRSPARCNSAHTLRSICSLRSMPLLYAPHSRIALIARTPALKLADAKPS